MTAHTKPRRAWKDADVIDLTAMWRAGIPTPSIARFLDRTEGAIETKAGELGLGRRQPRRRAREEVPA